MSIRVLFLGEGSSDNGLITHIESVAVSIGIDVLVSAPELARLPRPPGHSVAAKLTAVRDMGGIYELVVIHRDSDNVQPQERRNEVAQAIESCMPHVEHIAVVPVRMTEAWLLLDEALIRSVAGNPNGRAALDLPQPHEVEGLPNPKDRLAEALVQASGLHGRRLKTFRQRFPQYRRQIFERLDPKGPVSEVPSWIHFVNDLTGALERFEG